MQLKTVNFNRYFIWKAIHSKFHLDNLEMPVEILYLSEIKREMVLKLIDR